MTCIPEVADADRTVLKADAVDASDGWWTGLVEDRDYQTGETRLRLERWKDNGGSYNNPHTWRVHPEFWKEECEAVATFNRIGGDSPPASLPIDDYLTPIEYQLIRRDGVRWVAVIRLNRPHYNECTRLYHWDPDDGSVRQKWTVGRTWSELKNLATRHLQKAIA